MNVTAIQGAARLLCAARRNGQLLDALPEPCRPTTIDEAHAVQVATAALLDDAIDGWKVATTPEGRVARGGFPRVRRGAGAIHGGAMSAISPLS